MTLIVNGTEIENVIVVKRATGESIELEKLQDPNGNVIWEKVSDTIFEVKRFTPKDIQSGGPAGSQIIFNVTAGESDAFVEYGGNVTTIPAGTTVKVTYGTDGTTDDGTPVTGTIRFFGNVLEIAGESWNYGSKSITSGYGNITKVVSWGGVKKLGDYLFSNTKLVDTTLKIGGKVENLGNYVFMRSNIQNVNMPNTPLTFGTNVFEDAELTQFDIPSWMENIPRGFLTGCYNLKHITIPKTVISFAATLTGANTFQGSGLETVTFESPTALTIIGAYTFAETKLTTIDVPEGISKIDTSAFNGITTLTTINLPQSLTTIEADAFRQCTGLTSITIPSNVNKIDMSAFYNCTNLASVIFENSNGWVNNNGEAVDFSDASTAATTLKAGGSVGIYYTRS